MNGTTFPSLFQIAADALMANPGWLDEAVGEEEAERITNTPKATLQTMRVRGGGPPFVKHGARVKYIRRDLFEWLTAGRCTSTSDTVHAAKSANSGTLDGKGEGKGYHSPATSPRLTELAASDNDETFPSVLAGSDSDQAAV